MKKTLSLTSLILIASFAWAQTALPAGTAVKMKLETTLATFSSKAGDPFSARVTEPVVMDGKTVIPIGTTVEGRVTKTNEPRRIAGKPTIAIFPENLVLPNGDRFMLNASLVDTNARRGSDVNPEGQFKGDGHDAKDLTEIGMGTGGGMLIGGLAGGGKRLPHRRSRRRHRDRHPLARQAPFRDASGRYRVGDGIEPSDDHECGRRQQRPVARIRPCGDEAEPALSGAEGPASKRGQAP